MLKIVNLGILQFISISVFSSLILFAIFDSDNFKRQRAVQELGGFAVAALTEQEYSDWLTHKNLNRPFWVLYYEWVQKCLNGDFGYSFEKNTPVKELVLSKLKNTSILAGLVFLFMIPLALITGILAGINEGKWLDRLISNTAVFFTSLPEISIATLLTVIFGLVLNWLPSKSAMINGFSFKELILPVLTLVLYDFGYIARMTRISVCEVMTSNYIRTAILKGLSYRRIVFRHALRNAMITPLTIIILQLNWLLSGVVVIEFFFEYDGFGKLILEAVLFADIYVIQMATLIAIGVAVISQVLSDICYTFLNPRIRFN